MNENQIGNKTSEISKYSESRIILAVSNNDKQYEEKRENSLGLIPVKEAKNKMETKKNRTLQYYKFLLYSIKSEIKLNEFYSLIKFSSFYEIAGCIIGLLLMISGKLYFNYVWILIFHFIRGSVGFYLLENLPRSYNLIEKFKLNEKDLETKVFNDIVRENLKENVFDQLKKQKNYLILYFLLNFLNYLLDLIAFFYCLSLVPTAQYMMEASNCVTNCSSYFNNSTNSSDSQIDMELYYELKDTTKLIFYVIIFGVCMLNISEFCLTFSFRRCLLLLDLLLEIYFP